MPPSPIARVLRSEFLRHGAIVFGSTMIVNVLTYVYNMVMSRYLGVGAYGALASLVALYNIAVVPALVVTTTTVKFAAELHAIGDRERLGALARTARLLALGITGLLVAAALIGGPAASTYLRIDGPGGLALVALGAGAALLLAAVRGLLQGVQDYRGLAISMTLEVVARVVCGFGLAYAGFGVGGAMSGFMLGNLLSLAASELLATRHCDRPRAPVRLDLRRFVITSAGIAGSSLATTGLGYVDVVLVKHYFDAHTAGLYGVLSIAGKAIVFAVAFVPAILLPKAVDRRKRGESPRRVLVQALVATGAMTACALALYFVAPTFVLRVLGGPAYLAIAPHVFSYGCAMSLLAFTTLIATYRIGMHRFGFVGTLLVVLACEIAGVAAFHRTIDEVIRTLLLGNAFALLAVLYGIEAREPATARI